MLGIQVAAGNTTVLIINVYMPWESHTNFDQYCMVLGDLQGIIQDSTADHVCIIGDLNAHPSRQFFNELTRFCQNHSLVISDVSLLPPSSYTHTQTRANFTSTSWLDHCITSSHLHDSVTNCIIPYNHATSLFLPPYSDLSGGSPSSCKLGF